ncbi:MAG: isochorismate synthase [Actinomycetes bacterium]
MHSRLITAEELGLAQGFEFTELLGSATTSFLHQNQGLIGWGEAQTITAKGANRITELDANLREIVAQATIEDQVNLPGSGLIAFGSIAFADQSNAESVLVIPQLIIGLRDSRLWLTRINIEEKEALALIQKTTTNQSVRFEPGHTTSEQFIQNVVAALDLINTNAVEKVVLARDLKAEVTTSFNINPAIATLSKKFSSCFTYSVAGLFGSSPELLVQVSHSQVSARVLAGTAGRGTDPGVDQAIGAALLSSTKNRAEHKFAVDSLVSALDELCIEIDADNEPFSLSLPNLWHLASDVHAVLKADSSSLQVVNALHPSAAVAGTPKDRAIELIQQIETIDRGRYAGPVGWLGADGDGVWAIALRGAQLEQNTLTAFAGCGIVAGSDPEAELQETNLKFKPIVEALA